MSEDFVARFEAVTSQLRGRLLRGPVIAHEVTGSTNDDAAALARAGAGEGTVVVADSQGAGRGRHGRRWEARPGTALMFSVVLRPSLPPAEWGRLATVAGVAVAETLRELTGVAFGAKWPNDIVVSGRKVCGMLLEASAPDFAVLGIGVNVSGELPEDLTATAGTLANVSGASHDRRELLVALLAGLDRCCDELLTTGPADLMRRAAGLETTIGRQVVARTVGGDLRGVATGLSPAGELLVQTDGGVVYLDSGEVALLREQFPQTAVGP